MTTNLTRRRCNGKTCVTPLNQYNDDPDGLCGACRVAANDAWAKFMRENVNVRAESEVPETRPGSQTWRILRAMPGTVSQLAEKTRIDTEKVRIAVRDLRRDGRADSRPIKQVGFHGESVEYVCLVEDLPGPTGAAGQIKYTRETLIETLHDMKRMLGRTPTADDCGFPWPSCSTFRRHFPTWAQALEAAGMREYVKPRAALIALLAEGPSTSGELAKKLGRNQNAVTCNLSDMWRVGVVEREKQGRGFLYRLVKQDGA